MAVLTARAQTSAFTYQGRLSDGGAAASGVFDFRFDLFPGPVNGSPVVSTVDRPAVTVVGGLFTVELDFGAAAFDGSDRWLEISVRANGNEGAHTLLTPRQRVTATPYAMRALTAGTAGGVSGTIPASQITGSLAPGQIPAGTTVVSPLAEDSALLSAGLVAFSRLPAPAWGSGTSTGEPVARQGHAAVWTGDRLIIWGGEIENGNPLGSGALYSPATDVWQVVSPVEAPDARSGHAAVWSGSEMMVWGGLNTGGFLGNGARFNPANQTWTAITDTDAPAARTGHIGVWTGTRFLVWGGRNAGGLLDDGGLYDPVADEWTPLTVASPPAARQGAAAAWAGDRLVVWGGEGALGALGDGAQLTFSNPAVPLAWGATQAANAPSARQEHTAVWTGQVWLVWGGRGSGGSLGDGAAYDPVADTWTTLATSGAPTARTRHSAVWTGAEMVVWGGESASGTELSGGAYSPVGDVWRGLTNPGAAVARQRAGAAWTGTEMLVFGGRNSTVVSALERLNPQPEWHLYRKP